MEPFPNDLTCIGNQYECGRIFFFNKIPQQHGLMPVQRGKDDILLRSGKGPLPITDRGAAVQLMYDKITDWLRPAAEYVKILGQVQAFDKVVHQHRAERQSQAGVQPHLHVKHEKSGYRDRHVGQHQCPADVNAGILFQDHGYDICAAAGSPDIEQHRGSESRKHDREDHLQQRLVRKRLMHGPDPFKQGQQDREQDAAVSGLRHELPPQDHGSQHQQDHVCRKRKIRRGDQPGFCDKDSETRDPAECKIIGKLKKINPYGHDQGGRCHHKEAVHFRFHLFFPPYRIVTPQSRKVNYL